jgi:hypothetical protein
MLAKYIDAQNSGTDIISFASGHKVGIVTDNKGKIPGIYGSNGEVSRESPKPLEILSRFIGIQVQTDDYAKDRVIFGSQIRKIILGNLPDELKEKRDYYISIIDELIDIERNKLMDELGLKLVDGVYKAVDLDKLVSTLKEQAIRRNLPDNIVDMLDVVKFDLTATSFGCKPGPGENRICTHRTSGQQTGKDGDVRKVRYSGIKHHV